MTLIMIAGPFAAAAADLSVSLIGATGLLVVFLGWRVYRGYMTPPEDYRPPSRSLAKLRDNRRCPSRRRLALVSIVGAELLMLPALSASEQGRHKFDIAPGDATSALKLFAAQSGAQLLYSTEEVSSIRTQELRGEYVSIDALERLLEGTPLKARKDPKTSAISIIRRTPSEPDQSKKAAPPSASGPNPKLPPKTTMKSRFLNILTGVLATSAGLLDAQTTDEAFKSAASAAVATAEPTVELSPFIVSTVSDNGYRATSTLAGTRLRSELGDVATTVSVVTAQFLKDTGATNTEGFLTYMTGTEVAGPGGNISGADRGGSGFSETNNLRRPQSTTRLRGLAAATESRNFFTTAIPLDSYNVDRVEINRGANSVLFGTGSPAGIINSSLKQALMKNVYEVEVRGDSNDSLRTSIDLNQQILPGELALRIAGLDKRGKYEQEFAFANDKRIYGALNYDPKWARSKNGALSGTVLRASLEHGDLDSRRPRTLPPTDSLSGWFNPWFGGYPTKLTWDAGTQRTTTVIDGFNAFASSPGMRTLNPIFRNPNVWFIDPASSTPGAGYSVNGVPISGGSGVSSNMPAGVYPAGTGALMMAGDIQRAATLTAGVADATFYINPTLSDTSVFDFRNQLLEGPNRLEYANFRALNASFEQRFFSDRAGVELSFDKQRFVGGTTGFSGTALQMDINTSLLDGTPNPNFARPYVSGSWNSTRSEIEYETRRATAFYRFDFAEVMTGRVARWLGNHTFTFLEDRSEQRELSLSGSRYYSPTYTLGSNQLLGSADGIFVANINYIGPSLASSSTASGANLPGLTALQNPLSASGQNFRFRGQTAASQFVTQQLVIQDAGIIPYSTATTANKGGTDLGASAMILQSKMLDGILVTTFGWRRDQVDSYVAPTPPVGPINNLLVDTATWPFPATPSTSVTDESISKGVVLHTPARFLRRIPAVNQFSLRYTEAGNFSPGSARIDSTLANLAPPSGTTRDYGFILGLADNKVVLSTTWYETVQSNVSSTGIANLTSNIVNLWSLFTNMTNMGLNPNAADIIAPPAELLAAYGFRVTNGAASFNSRPDIVLTQDVASKGVEFEVNVNLTKNWRMLINAARQESVRTNTGRAFRELFFERKFGSQTLYENWTGPAGAQAVLTIGRETLAARTASNIANPFNNEALQDGGPAQELRKWRANVVTHYDFRRDGPLSGFGIGGGARWQDKVAIGFPVTTASTGQRVSDVKNPYYGPAEVNVDAWLRYERPILRGRVNLTLQFNVFNALNENDLIPVATQPDGSIAAYRIPSSRRYELTTRFGF